MRSVEPTRPKRHASLAPLAALKRLITIELQVCSSVTARHQGQTDGRVVKIRRACPTRIFESDLDVVATLLVGLL